MEGVNDSGAEVCCGVGLYHMIRVFLGDVSDAGITTTCLFMFFDGSLKCDRALKLDIITESSVILKVC